MPESSTAVGAVVLAGRLGDSEMSLATDPRADPRLVAALATFGLDVHGAEPPVSLESPREEVLEFIGQAEQGFEAVFAALYDGLPAVEGVSAETRLVTGVDGNGTCHAGDVIFRRDMPEVHAATIHDIKSFADSL